MKLYRPQKIYIEKGAENFPQTRTILKNLSGVPYEITEHTSAIAAELARKNDPIGESKRYLLLKRDLGRSFRRFSESSEDYIACDYFTLHVAEGCDLECSYCILQSYLTNPFLTLYVNLDEMLDSLKTALQNNPHQFFRIGTGQLTDSLSLDPVTEYSKTLVPFFADQPNAVLEFKTKSSFVDNLLSLNHGGNTIVSWSMNSEKVQSQEEHKCASLTERLQAAQKVIRAGYRVGFHMDPLIDYEGWETDYSKLIERIFSEVPADKTAWISLGCLRFMPDLKKVMQERFPKSPLPLAEWVTGMDGKMRYFKPRRIEMYQTLVRKIKHFAPSTAIYLSMESPEVWRRVFGEEPTKTSVCSMLDLAGKKG